MRLFIDIYFGVWSNLRSRVWLHLKFLNQWVQHLSNSAWNTTFYYKMCKMIKTGCWQTRKAEENFLNQDCTRVYMHKTGNSSVNKELKCLFLPVGLMSVQLCCSETPMEDSNITHSSGSRGVSLLSASHQVSPAEALLLRIRGCVFLRAERGNKVPCLCVCTKALIKCIHTQRSAGLRFIWFKTRDLILSVVRSNFTRWKSAAWWPENGLFTDSLINMALFFNSL